MPKKPKSGENFEFSELRRELAGYLDNEQINNIRHAFEFAKKAHEGQNRLSGEAYISHPLAVAKLLADMRMDSATITAAILHDVLEDTPVTKKTLATAFSNEVAELVDGVSKLDRMTFDSHAEAQAENFRKMLLAMVRDMRVILVKLADRLHNMRTLEHLSQEKQQRIAKETLEIYAPIANRLGMHNFRIEFEDMAFSILYPLRYRALKSAVEQARASRKPVLSTIKKNIKSALEKHGLPASSVIGRQKHLYSIYHKMREKKRSFHEIMDVYGFRVVTENIDTCYRVFGMVHNLYKPMPAKFKDYIAIPKANGYQSLHTTLFGPYGVPIEVQIRTAEMDNFADNGIAAHWLYKTGEQTPSDAELRARSWLKKLLEMQHNTGNSVEFIENVKIELFPDEVYIFTPQGKIMELPNGATAIDFAYAVHSDIGHSCVSAKIDRRLAPLSTVLHNGQTVEIITAKNACPSPDWLNFCVSGKARGHIRHFLKEQRHVASTKLGKELLDNALASLEAKWEMVSDEICKNLLKQLSFLTPDDLFESIGLGKLPALAIARQLLDLPALPRGSEEKTAPLSIKGTEGMLVHFSTCCRPIPGDPITGLICIGEGIEIHQEQCPTFISLTSEKHISIPVRWETNIEGEFPVELRIELFDRRGALAEITSVIANTDANIEDISTANSDGRYSAVHLTLTVQNRVHLAQVIRNIRRLNAVTRIIRCVK